MDDAILGQRLGASRLGVNVFLAWAIDGDLDGDLAAINFLAVHLGDGLLLQFLGGKRDETEATALAGFVACLKFSDHKARDGTESDLGGGRLVCGEKFLELGRH